MDPFILVVCVGDCFMTDVSKPLSGHGRLIPAGSTGDGHLVPVDSGGEV